MVWGGCGLGKKAAPKSGYWMTCASQMQRNVSFPVGNLGGLGGMP